MMNKLHKLVNQGLVSYYLLQLRKDQWKDPRQLKNIQFKKLKAIIKHAYTYVPYYHRKFSSANIKPEAIKNFDDIKRIPLISKRNIQKNYRDFIVQGIDESKLTSRVTSGSTGIPLKLISDSSVSPSSSKYQFFECGVKSRDNFVTVWGRGAESIRWGSKYVRLWGDISETFVPLFPEETLIEVLRRINPDVLLTFPSVLSTLANYDLSGINPRLIFTQGEMVTEHCRDIVKKKLNLELFETYGSVEFGGLAFECNEHCGLHMITDVAYLEFVDEEGEQVSPGERGEIIVTGLYNHAMPLIRYRIGDSGIPSDEKCPCGRSWPLIKSIEGRINDYCVLPSGRKISWLYLLRFILYDEKFKRNVFSISQYQIIQERKNRIIFKVVKGTTFDPEILERIKNKIETSFAKQGENLEVAVQLVKEIPMERTGKRRLFISKLN